MKIKAAEIQYEKLQSQLSHINEIVQNSKVESFYEHDKMIRDKLVLLFQIKTAVKKAKNNKRLLQIDNTIERFQELLDYISEKLINDYNTTHNTEFSFLTLRDLYYDSYISSGIISVLVNRYIPNTVNKKLELIFKENPKDEYTEIRKIKRKFYLHLGETNTGKTYRAMECLKESKKGVYLAPLRILALENYEKLKGENVKCSLLTGEEEIKTPENTHVCSTIEKLNLEEEYDVGIIDEIQMIADPRRGAAWTRAVLGLNAKEIHICGALNAKEIIIKLLDDLEEEYELKEYKRDIPLIVEEKPFILKNIREKDALIVFSKRRVLELASYCMEQGIRCSLIYGDLPPEVRRNQYEEFLRGDSKIVISTDAIGMGVNLPIQRIVFMDIKKFDGEEVRILNSQEIKQICGRAGRKGVYDKGYVSAYGGNIDFIKEGLNIEDMIIKRAILGPSEDILQIKEAQLIDKLKIWSEKPVSNRLYKKMDISEKIEILEIVKKYKLKEEDQWKILWIPLDIEDESIINELKRHIEDKFICEKQEILKPKYRGETLGEMELYYKKINLYYSFNKAFKLSFDDKWVNKERQKIATIINYLLINI